MKILSQENIRDGASRMEVEISQEQAQQLLDFSELLLKWNRTYNLTSITRREDVLELHIFDSISLVKTLEGVRLKRVLDVGSGGGLPAIPLAILRPEVSVTMIDAVKKKVGFLQQAITVCHLSNAQVVHGRVEAQTFEPFDAVTCRAFATLAQTVELTQHCLRQGGRWYCMKGKNPVEEISALPAESVLVENLEIRLPDAFLERRLIVLEKVDGAAGNF